MFNKISDGDVLSVTSLTCTDERVKITHSTDKNTRLVVLVLGKRGATEQSVPDKMMNDLGWVRKGEQE